MAKDLNTSNLGQIIMDGEELFVGFDDAERTEVLPAGVDGAVIDGVFVATGDVSAIASIGREVKLPKTLKAREAFLRKWAEKAAQKAKANKGLSATLLILPLAACGGGGGDAPAPAAFEVTVAGNNISFANLVDGFIRFVDVTSGATVVFGSGEGAARQTDAAEQLTAGVTDKTLVVAQGQTLEVTVAQLQSANVEGFKVTGAGNVVFLWPEAVAGSGAFTATIRVDVELNGGSVKFDMPTDDNDVLTLAPGSRIVLNNGGTLEVSDGTVDARAADIQATLSPGTENRIIANSKLILTGDQFIALGADASGSGVIEIVVADAAEAQRLIDYLENTNTNALSAQGLNVIINAQDADAAAVIEAAATALAGAPSNFVAIILDGVTADNVVNAAEAAGSVAVTCQSAFKTDPS